MAESAKENASIDPKGKKLADHDNPGTEFLNSWKSMTVTKIDVTKYSRFDTISSGKKKGFNLGKLDMDFSLDGYFDKLSSFKVDLPNLDFSCPSKMAAKCEDQTGQESSSINHQEKDGHFSFSSDFNELDDFNLDSTVTKGQKGSSKKLDREVVSSNNNDDIGKEILSSWNDFNLDTICSGMKKGFNFKKLLHYLNLDSNLGVKGFDGYAYALDSIEAKVIQQPPSYLWPTLYTASQQLALYHLYSYLPNNLPPTIRLRDFQRVTFLSNSNFHGWVLAAKANNHWCGFDIFFYDMSNDRQVDLPPIVLVGDTNSSIHGTWKGIPGYVNTVTMIVHHWCRGRIKIFKNFGGNEHWNCTNQHVLGIPSILGVFNGIEVWDRPQAVCGMSLDIGYTWLEVTFGGFHLLRMWDGADELATYSYYELDSNVRDAFRELTMSCAVVDRVIDRVAYYFCLERPRQRQNNVEGHEGSEEEEQHDRGEEEEQREQFVLSAFQMTYDGEKVTFRSVPNIGDAITFSVADGTGFGFTKTGNRPNLRQNTVVIAGSGTWDVIEFAPGQNNLWHMRPIRDCQSLLDGLHCSCRCGCFMRQ